MNVITDTWRGLVARKLWPVALLLVAALVAVPLTLAKEPESAPVVAANATKPQEGLPETFVSAADVSAAGERRRVLGGKKDPFEPAALPKVTRSEEEGRRSRAGRDAGSIDDHRRQSIHADRRAAREHATGPEADVPAVLDQDPLRQGRRRTVDELAGAPEGAPVGRVARARLPGRGRRRQGRGLPGHR